MTTKRCAECQELWNEEDLHDDGWCEFCVEEWQAGKKQRPRGTAPATDPTPDAPDWARRAEAYGNE